MSKQAKRQVFLAAYYAGVNESVLWEDSEPGAQIDFDSLKHVVQTAERGRFDYFFLAEGLALRQRGDRFFEHDIAGRPDTLPILAALSAVTEHIGLVGTLNTTFNEPYELARQLASLDHLSGGRAGWNVVTSFDAYTGANFRRGGYLDRDLRYRRAEEFVHAVKELWDSWPEDAILADKDSGEFLATDAAGEFARSTDQFDISGRFTVPRSPQGRPVIVQAGISGDGRNFAAANADVIFSPFHANPEAQEFFRDVKQRVEGFGRHRDSLKILPGSEFMLGDTEAEAQELARETLDRIYTPTTALVRLEQVWNRDLSNYDPDGPLPDLEPVLDGPNHIQGRTFYIDRQGTIDQLRALSESRGLNLRETAREFFGRIDYVGTPEQVADQIIDFVDGEGADGLVLGPRVTPHGLDEFVDRVVPILQERGALRTEYEGSTLRDNLGLPVPERGEQAPAFFA